MTRRVKAQSRRAPSALGTVRQLPSGRWQASYRRDARTFKAPRTFATRAEADTWITRELADRSRGTWQDPEAGRVTLAEYADAWIDSHDHARSSKVRYRGIVARWLRRRIGTEGGARGIELGSVNVADLTPALIRSWRASVIAEVQAGAATRALPIDRRHPARAWAQGQGMDVPVTGKLSRTVVEAWEAAGKPQQDRRGPVAEGVGLSTAAHAYRFVRAVLNTAVDDGMITTNPCRIRGGGQDRAKERPVASPEDVQAIARHMPRRYAAAVTVAAWSSARFGELFALARRHVDLDAGSITIERSLDRDSTFKTPKTSKSRRTIFLPAFVVADLRAHLAEFTGTSPDALVFTSMTGAPCEGGRIGRAFRRARKLAGREDLHWHDLRHTAATLAYRAGASVPEVQRRLGHTTMRAAQIYAHAADDSDRLIAERLNAVFAPAAVPHLRAV